MKVKSLLIIVACMTIVFAGCKKKESNPAPLVRPASMEYSKQDTTAIHQLLDEYVNLLKNNDLESASQMLHIYRNDSIFPINEEKREGFIKGLSLFNIYDCKIQGLLLRSECNNQATIRLQITEDGSIEEDKGVTSFNLNPVLVDGQWYLTLLDVNADGYEKIY